MVAALQRAVGEPLAPSGASTFTLCRDGASCQAYGRPGERSRPVQVAGHSACGRGSPSYVSPPTRLARPPSSRNWRVLRTLKLIPPHSISLRCGQSAWWILRQRYWAQVLPEHRPGLPGLPLPTRRWPDRAAPWRSSPGAHMRPSTERAGSQASSLHFRRTPAFRRQRIVPHLQPSPRSLPTLILQNAQLVAKSSPEYPGQV